MAISEHLSREIQRWVLRDDESDQDWEDRVYAGVKSAALQLLCASKALGWGGKQPVIDAQMHVETVAQEHGDFFQYHRPPTSQPRISRKSLATGMVRAVFDRDGWECVECGSHRDLTVDHKIPLALCKEYGIEDPDDIDNLQTMCRPHNLRKGARV